MVVSLLVKPILEFRWCCFQVPVVAIAIVVMMLTLRVVPLAHLHIEEVTVHLTHLQSYL